MNHVNHATIGNPEEAVQSFIRDTTMSGRPVDTLNESLMWSLTLLVYVGSQQGNTEDFVDYKKIFSQKASHHVFSILQEK